MISVCGRAQQQASWVCRFNGLLRVKPGCYAIDARQEVTLIREDGAGAYAGYGESEEEDEERSETARDEREVVNIKHEKILNR